MSAPAPVLPAPAPVSVTSAMRLAYVLRHFRLAYEDVPTVAIGYPGATEIITVAAGAGDFFQQGQAYPPAPSWREWAGQRIPFFFDPQPGAALLELGAGQASIGADIIAGAFYLLSGWQEYFSDARDRHGRFPYAASVQQQYDFVTRPVVNYYFDVLKTALEHVTGRPLRPRCWAGGAPFAAFISHDIDNLHSAWKAPTKAALRQGNFIRFSQRLWQRLAWPDAWDNLEQVAATVAEYGAKSTFFILPEQRAGADGTPNADYILTPRLQQRLQKLARQDAEIGLHGSIGTAREEGRLRRESRPESRANPGLRFHYLRWEPRATPALVDAVGFGYDSTLGFAEHFGFRHSYCAPFYPFNFATGGAHQFLEIQLNIMDATLHHPHYLLLTAPEILPALQPMLAEIARFGGVATVLWHNDHFDPANAVTGPAQFAEIMRHLQQQHAVFLTGSQILAEL